MTWNYRVLNHGDQFAIHEVYYDESGVAVSFTEKPSFPRGKDFEALSEDFQRYSSAFEKPVLWVGDGDKLVEQN